jgi:hypothetical protein
MEYTSAEAKQITSRLEKNSRTIFPTVSDLFAAPAADFTSRQHKGNKQQSIDYRYSSA